MLEDMLVKTRRIADILPRTVYIAPMIAVVERSASSIFVCPGLLRVEDEVNVRRPPRPQGIDNKANWEPCQKMENKASDPMFYARGCIICDRLYLGREFFVKLLIVAVLPPLLITMTHQGRFPDETNCAP
ncbi:hypothetical protein E4U15_007888, partial [Claviceps sp. LM218 group G6]